MVYTVYMAIQKTKEEKTKNDFVAVDMHQLRNYLTRNKWLLDSLTDESNDKIVAVPHELLSEMEVNNNEAINLVSDVLRVDEEDSDVFKPFPVKVDLLDIIQKDISNMTVNANRKNILIEFTHPGELLPVIIHPEKISYVFENLLANAIRYTPKKGKIFVHVTHANDEIVVSFKDTGIGIPPLEQANIFRKYFRATNARKMESQGSGLGLYIVKRIVEEHDGRIWFESDENMGTTFWIALPVSKMI